MTNAEFLALLVSNTNKTTHLRTYSGHWYTGASRVPNSLSTKIGKIVALLQQQIDEGKLCDKQSQCLLIHDFQPAALSDNLLFCNLNMVIKPLSRLNDTKDDIGKQLQVAVDGNTQRVINNTQIMIELGLISEAEIKQEQLEPPTVFGHYPDYKALCCFVAFASYKPIFNTDDLFAGQYDQGVSMQQSVAFDSWTEAHQYLAERKELGRYVLEVGCAKEDYPQVLKESVSKRLLKIVNFFDMKTEVNSNENTSFPRANIKEELEKIQALAFERKSSNQIQTTLTGLTGDPGKRKFTLSMEEVNAKKTKEAQEEEKQEQGDSEPKPSETALGSLAFKPS